VYLAPQARGVPIEPGAVCQDLLPFLAFLRHCVVGFAIDGCVFVVRAILGMCVLGGQRGVPLQRQYARLSRAATPLVPAVVGRGAKLHALGTLNVRCGAPQTRHC
jgi:hypothetical protein